MREMTRADVQDLLPDLLHGRLPAAVHADVERVVAADPDLSAELAVLRRLHAVHAASPVVDISRIVAALPTPPNVMPSVAAERDELAARRRMPRAPRFAGFARAAAVLLVLGGSALVATRVSRTPDSAVATSAPAESLALVADAVQLGLGVPTDDLTVEQLRALERDIDALDGEPSAEPDAITNLADGEGA